MWLHRLHVQVCVIVHADDAAGDIVCLCVCPPLFIAKHKSDVYIVVKSWDITM
jgi:hypothetical protein